MGCGASNGHVVDGSWSDDQGPLRIVDANGHASIVKSVHDNSWSDMSAFNEACKKAKAAEAAHAAGTLRGILKKDGYNRASRLSAEELQQIRIQQRLVQLALRPRTGDGNSSATPVLDDRVVQLRITLPSPPPLSSPPPSPPWSRPPSPPQSQPPSPPQSRLQLSFSLPLTSLPLTLRPPPSLQSQRYQLPPSQLPAR